MRLPRKRRDSLPAVGLVCRRCGRGAGADIRARLSDVVLSSTSDVVYAWNRQRQLVYTNRRLTRDGYAEKATANPGCTTSELFLRHVDQVFATKEPITGEIPYTCPTGLRGYWECIFRPVTGEDGSVELVVGVSRDVSERRRAEQALRESEQQFASLLKAAEHLQDLSIQLIQADKIEVLYEQILDTAAEILHADFASLQVFHPERGTGGKLHLLGHRGFSEDALRFWEWVYPSSLSTCGVALRTRQRVMVPDVQNCDFMAGSSDQKALLQAGIRAGQTTPLLSRTGILLGAFSTHWRKPHDLTAAEIRSLDVLARQAADLIDRMLAEQELRKSKERQSFLLQLSDSLRPLSSAHEIMHVATQGLARRLGTGSVGYHLLEEDGEALAAPGESRGESMSGTAGTCLEAGARDFLRVLRASQDLACGHKPTGTGEAIQSPAGTAIPLFRDGRLVACIYAAHPEMRPWPDHELSLMREVAERAWNAVERTRAEAALRGSEEKYRTLFHSMGQGFCVIEKVEGQAGEPEDFRYIEANPAFAVQSGVDDVVGKTLRQALAGESEKWLELYNRVLQTGEAIRFQSELATIGRVLEFYAFRVEDKTQRRAGTILTDITERKRAEEALRESEVRHRLAIQASRMGVWTLDVATGRLDADGRMAEIIGLGPAASYSGPFTWDSVHPDDRSTLQAVLDETLDPTKRDWFEVEVRLVHADGTVRWVQLNGQAMFEGGESQRRSTRILGTVRDVTGRIQAQEALRQSQEGYRRLAEQLQEADRRKDEFIGVLSHEIRNPLTAIKLSLSLLRRLDLDGERAGMMKDIMNRQVTHLSRLIDDLLDVTRISRNRVVLQKKCVELTETVRRTLEDYKPVVEEKGVRLESELVPTSICVDADEDRLVQVVGNLLHNAVKFTSKGGVIKVAVAQEGQDAVIRINDNGHGMTPEVLSRVFQPFVQADNSLHRSDGGLGLGLVLVKEFVELHGGAVTAHSDGLGKGSEFTVRLPLVLGLAASGIPPVPPAPPQHRRRVLIIDDMKDMAESLKSLLEREGHEVTVAYNGMEGLARAKVFRPQILLCDIGLPVADGYEVARAIRADDDLKDVFLVSLTGYARPQDSQRAKEAGFDLHLAKPVDLDTLRKTLARVQ